MWYHVEQQIIRTVMALSALAAHDMRPDVAEDVRDGVAALIHLWVRAHTVGAGGQDPLVQLTRWCMRLHERLQDLGSDTGQASERVLAAQRAVLRLRVALAEQTPREQAKKTAVLPPVRVAVATRVSGANQKKVLDFIRERSIARTKELTDHFAASLSDRTVKRCLKDLVAAGTIIRIQTDRAVSYRLSS